MTRPWPLATLLACACSEAAPSAAPPDAHAVAQDASAPGSAEPAPRTPAGGEPLDPQEALRAEQAAGFTEPLRLQSPVRCPTIVATPGPPRLAAAGARAGLVADPEAFLREDVGVADVVALFGPVALCALGPGGRGMRMFIAPRDDVRRVELTTLGDALRVLRIDFEAPAPVDLAELRRGLGDGWPATNLARRSLPPLAVFEATSPAYSGQFALWRERATDDALAGGTRSVVYGRAPRTGLMPAALAREDDLVRVLAHMLGPARPDAADFDGALGPLHDPHGSRYYYYESRRRNIARATLDLDERAPGEPVGLAIDLAEPIAATPEGLARGLAEALRSSAPAVVRSGIDGREARMDVHDADARPSGSIVLRLAGATITGLAVSRRPGDRRP